MCLEHKLSCVTFSLGLSVFTCKMGRLRQSLHPQSLTKTISETPPSCRNPSLIWERK